MLLKGRTPAAFRWCFITRINNNPPPPNLRAGSRVWKKELRAESERPCVPTCCSSGRFVSEYITPVCKITSLILARHTEMTDLALLTKANVRTRVSGPQLSWLVKTTGENQRDEL